MRFVDLMREIDRPTLQKLSGGFLTEDGLIHGERLGNLGPGLDEVVIFM